MFSACDVAFLVQDWAAVAWWSAAQQAALPELLHERSPIGLIRLSGRLKFPG